MECFSFDDFSLFLAALDFSAEKHRNQRRKDKEQTPYVNHPIAVAELLWRVGSVRRISVLAAALLHDLIEDTSTSGQELRGMFGEEVESLVLAVTDDKTLPKDVRKELQVVHAPELSMEAKLIKIADKICNVRDVTFRPPPNWPLERRVAYLDWAERVVNGLGPCNGALEALFRETLSRCRAELRPDPNAD